MARRVVIAGVLLALLGGGGYVVYRGRQPVCQVCARPLHSETFYRIHLEGGKTEEVCCPRCGLRFQKGRRDVLSAEVADFFSGESLDAQAAFYVENSAVHLCCPEDRVRRDPTGGRYVQAWDRCLPSLVAFKSREEAERFRREKGGTIKTYADLLAESY